MVLLIFLALVFHVCLAVEIDPHLHNSQLRFPWGINFKYHGQLHRNFPRMWVVIKFNITPLNKFHFPSVKITPDCDFNISRHTYDRSSVDFKKITEEHL